MTANDWGDLAGTQDNIVNTSDALAAISLKVDELVNLKAKLDEANGRVSDLELKIKEIEERTIPELMDSVRQEKIRTANGHTVEIVKTVRASIPADKKDAAFAWIESTGNAGMIKREVAVSFGVDEEKKATKLAAKLGKDFDNVKTERWVEPATLKKFVTDRLKAGEPVADVINVFEQKTTKIK